MAIYDFKNSNNNEILPMEIIITSNGRVLKFANNLAIAVGTDGVDISDMTAWGGMFYKSVNVTFGGFNFAERPWTFISTSIGSSWVGRIVSELSGFSCEVYRATQSVGNISLWYLSIGKWK